MRSVLCAAAGLAWLAGMTSNPASSPNPRVQVAIDSVDLAAKLAGQWNGSRYQSGSTVPHRFSMKWRKSADEHPTGKVTVASGPSYETSVVWSSDTGFVTESAPHRNAALQEQVVTRTVSHLKGDSVWGTYELRPTSYQGRTINGRFTAVRSK